MLPRTDQGGSMKKFLIALAVLTLGIAAFAMIKSRQSA
jgi:hypothetical protein